MFLGSWIQNISDHPQYLNNKFIGGEDEMVKSTLTILLFLLALSGYGYAAPSQAALDPVEVGVDERLGEYVPLDLTFYDENGHSVRLAELITQPTILTLL